jgi:uncharacterized phage-associated protein
MTESSSQASPPAVLWWFLKRATENGVRSLGRVRLVKLLYLLEVEYVRFYGRRLTDLTWKFYHYGPYPLQFEQLVETAGLETTDKPIDGNRILKALTLPEFSSKQQTLPAEIDSMIDSLVKEWADASLNRLLNYVYFETEPMREARRGDVLDFSRIKPISMYRKVPGIIDKKQLTAIRKSLTERLNKLAKGGSQQPIHPSIHEYLARWDEDESGISITGTANLQPEFSDDVAEDENS